MKRVLSMFVLMLTISIGTFAQKNLGDYIEIDAVPAFVFYLDQTREHGLAMSIPAFDVKGAKKADKLVKRGLMTDEQATIFKNNPLGQFNEQGTGGKKSKDLFVGLVDRLTDNGKTNQQQITAYCKEKNISLDNDGQRRSIQQNMNKIRTKWESRGFQMFHSQWEDWDGKKR